MLFQPQSVIIVEPVGQRLFKRPVERIATLCQFLAANVCRNLKFPYTGGANPIGAPIAPITAAAGMMIQFGIIGTDRFSPVTFFIASTICSIGVSRLVATIIEFRPILVMFHTIQHKFH